MRIAEEIDALDSLAIRPIPYLVTTRLMASVVAASLMIVVLLSYDIPLMHEIFTPTAPTAHGGVGVPFEPPPR